MSACTQLACKGHVCINVSMAQSVYWLQAALEAVQSEIMLFGLASLLLNLFETPIGSICSKPSPADTLFFWSQISCICQVTTVYLDGHVSQHLSINATHPQQDINHFFNRTTYNVASCIATMPQY